MTTTQEDLNNLDKLEALFKKCLDWKRVDRCADVDAYDLAKKINKILPEDPNAKNLVKYTHQFMELPGITKQNTKTLVIMGHIMQTLQEL